MWLLCLGVLAYTHYVVVCVGQGHANLMSVGAQEQLKLEVSNEPAPVVMLDLGYLLASDLPH